jgi:hypothetical protein
MAREARAAADAHKLTSRKEKSIMRSTEQPASQCNTALRTSPEEVSSSWQLYLQNL